VSVLAAPGGRRDALARRACFEYVLMDGGIKRHFRLEHCRRFLADLDAVKAFFLEGLPEKVVDSCTRRMSDLLKQLFEKDTAYLVKLYATAPDNGDSTVATK
jgi:hypothetical protein